MAGTMCPVSRNALLATLDRQASALDSCAVVGFDGSLTARSCTPSEAGHVVGGLKRTILVKKERGNMNNT